MMQLLSQTCWLTERRQEGESHPDRPWQGACDFAELLCHAHDNFAAKGVAHKHFREEFHMPEQAEDITG